MRVFCSERAGRETLTDVLFALHRDLLPPKPRLDAWYFRPACGESAEHLPKPLDQVYSLIDGMGDGQPGWHDTGLVRFRALSRSLGNWGTLTGYQPTVDMDQEVIAYFNYGTGDCEFVDNGRSIEFNHETRVLRDRGDLTELLEQFFERLQRVN